MVNQVVKLTGKLPKMVVFDLDYTLWDLWVDTHVTPPLKRRADDLNLIYDKHGSKMSYYPDVPDILLQLHHSNIIVAAASRTSAPRAARQALTELLIPGELRSSARSNDPTARKGDGVVSSINLFEKMEIYPGSKMKHFEELHKKTGVAYEDMVFFDDESRNMEVTKLGVTFVLVQNGVNRRLFESGLDAWRNKRSTVEP